MKMFRKVLFWVHLVLGIIAGLDIAILACTGMLMAFEHPIVRYAERVNAPPPSGINPTDKQKAWYISDLVSAAAAAPAPNSSTGAATSPSSVTAYPDLTRPVTVQFGRDRTLYLNNFTGKIVGQGAPHLRTFFSTVQNLHRWLALGGTGREWGRYITHAACLCFLFLILSGIVLWIPKHLRLGALRAVLVPSFRLRGKARDWNWHNVAGIWLCLPLLIITLTGTIMAFPLANRLMYRAVGETPPIERGDRGNPAANNRRAPTDHRPDANARQQPLNLDGIDDLWEAAEFTAKPGWTSMTFQIGGRGGGRGGGSNGNNANDDHREASGRPDTDIRSDQANQNAGGKKGGDRGGATIVFSYGDSELPTNRVTMTFDRRTGELTGTERFSDQSRGRQLRSLLVPIHRGEILGITGMSLAALSCLGALLLVYTGFALSWRRLVRPLLTKRQLGRSEELKGREPYELAGVIENADALATSFDKYSLR